MLPLASDDGSPSRSALEESLTLNKRSSWFGSFRSAVHRGALSAKAAVESLRGSHGSISSVTSPSDASVSFARCTTPSRQPVQEGVTAPKSAVASLRHNLSRRSRKSRHGSISSVFRRSGSSASSLHGAHDPEAIVRSSQETSKTASPLVKNGNKSKDPATLVPLPSSPIDIPPPPPILRVDLGPPAMLSPFAMTKSDLAEIKVLQDPTNITTGIPPSCPLDWRDEDFSLRLRREALAAGGEPQNTGGCQPMSVENCHSGLAQDSVISPFERLVSCVTGDKPRRIGEPRDALVSERSWKRLCESHNDPFQDLVSLPRDPHQQAAVIKAIDTTLEQQTLDCDRATTRNVHQSTMVSVVDPQTRTDTGSICEDLLDESIDPFQLPLPVVALKIPPSQRTSDVAECAVSVEMPHDSDTAPVDAEVSRAQQKYRDSLAGLEEGLVVEKLESAVTRHVEQNPFIGAPGTPAPSYARSKSIATTVHSSPSDENFDAIQIPTRVIGVEKRDQESKENGKDGLLEGTKHEIVHSHGPPSPERQVRLPLRPKSTLTKHTSFESTLFKPILDRVAAKHLGVFRPGSDPSLRQKYFPHSAVNTNSPVRYPRQPSLDLEDTESDTTGSCDDIGIFERTVEQPSPLHIRKQSNTTPIHAVPSPQTPASTSTPQAPGSSPTRTPSMGDRQQFDLQRAERAARYNAIHSGEFSSTALNDNSDIQLAEFGNAGPGSRGSTPTRSSGGRGRDTRTSPAYLQRVMGQSPSPSPRFGCATVNRAFLALSKD